MSYKFNPFTGKFDLDPNAATIRNRLTTLTGDNRLDASAIKNLPGGGGTNEVIEWVTGDEKPTVVADHQIGDFEEGKIHLVTIVTVGESTTAIVQIENWTEGFQLITQPTVITATAVDNTKTWLYVNSVTGEGGSEVNLLKRYSLLGIEDTEFVAPVITPGYVQAMAFDGNNDLVLAGNFTGRVIKCDINGVVDETFDPTVLGTSVRQIAVDSNNAILVLSKGAGAICYLRRLNSDGTTDSAFTYSDTSTMFSICISDANRVFVAKKSGDNGSVILLLDQDGSVYSGFSAYTREVNQVYDLKYSYFWGRLYACYGLPAIPSLGLVCLGLDGEIFEAFTNPFDENAGEITNLSISGDGLSLIVSTSLGATLYIVDPNMGSILTRAIGLSNGQFVYYDAIRGIIYQVSSQIALMDWAGNLVYSISHKSYDLVTQERISALENNQSVPTTLFIELTYAEAIAAMGAGDLVPGTLYKITDRGDRGLFFQAISTTQFAATGTRRMLCPASYAVALDGYGNNWLGVWNNTKTAAENDLIIWGGLVWKNLTGEIGALVDDTTLQDITLDDTNWLLIPKTAFSNHEYVEMVFGVQFDWGNDWISKQWDNKGNVFGMDYLTEHSQDNGFSYGYNLCDISDWNFSTNGFLFYNNNCLGCYNNSNNYTIALNTAQTINSNSNNGTIWGNITNNGISCNSNGIFESPNSGEISSNINAGISLNINNGKIMNNTNNGFIYQNSNSVGQQCNIQNNTSSTGNIYGVWNSDVIDSVTDKTGDVGGAM